MFTIGADVEVFAQDKEGKHRALCGKIGGTKEKPIPMFSGHNTPEKAFEWSYLYLEQFKVQEDNVALEFNIPVAHNFENFDESLAVAVQHCKDRLNKLGYVVSPASAVLFDKTELEHPQALVFGCEPDYDAWKMVENQKPMCSYPELRTAGGHVHIGTKANMIEVIRWLDLFLGVPSVILDTTPGSNLRRQLYGKAGAMRPKPYGEEYRVLSNFWIWEKDTRRLVYNAVKNAVQKAQDGKTLSKKEGEDIQTVINSGDITGAHTICETFGLTYK